MRNFLLFIFCCLTITVNAQTHKIYSKINYYDKFDDVLKSEQRKTLVKKTDSTFIIEEKGKDPIVYYILNPVEEGTIGSKDNIVNLVGNVYGYETSWCVVRYDLLQEYNESYLKYVISGSDEDLLTLQHFWIFIVHRTITTQFSGTYLDDLIWLSDEQNDNKLGKNVSRIIYLNE